jgi:hypothetical protein
VMEYHQARCPGDNPRKTAERLLGERGYSVVATESSEDTDTLGVLWALRELR